MFATLLLFCIAVLDTGVDASPCFDSRVAYEQSFVSATAFDGHGHGSRVARLVLDEAGDDAQLVVLKVVDDRGHAYGADVDEALLWVLAHHHEYDIRSVCLAVVSGGNLTEPYESTTRFYIQCLRAERIPVCCPAGNRYAGVEGMTAPAIFPETISVGAFDRRHLPAPYSQRLAYATDVFTDGTEPGGWEGTSFACARIAGFVTRLQEPWIRKRRNRGTLPPVGLLEEALRWKRGAYPELDRKKALRGVKRLARHWRNR